MKHSVSDENAQIALSQRLHQAVQLHRKGKLDQAERIYETILEAQANQFDAKHLLGVLRSQQNRNAEAFELIAGALKLNPNSAIAYSNFGTVLEKLGHFDDALTNFDRALVIKPDFLEPLNKRGKILRELKRYEEALAAFDEALAIKPDLIGALFNRSATLQALKRPEEALGSLDKVLAMKSDFVEALYYRGVALHDLGRLEEALESFDSALNIKSDFAEVFHYRGVILCALKRTEDSIESFNRALAIKPDFVDAFVYRGIVALLMGDFPSGWKAYERRFDQRGSQKRALIAPYPYWKGEDIKGKRIVVYQEQGRGDIIQFSRYLGLLSSLGAHVTFIVRSILHRLLSPSNPNVRFVETLSPNEAYDFQCALLSLPFAFGTTIDTVPSLNSYLFPEPALVSKWLPRLGGTGLKVGIAWQGNQDSSIGRDRSIPLRNFRSIGSIPGVRLFSLQKDQGTDQLDESNSAFVVETFGAELDSGPDSFIDTAAIIACLDLVITCDTAIAHLAGALGCPVWLMLKQVPEWRWMLDRSDSPWYPTMTLYRQTVRDDWGEAFGRAAEDLSNFDK